MKTITAIAITLITISTIAGWSICMNSKGMVLDDSVLGLNNDIGLFGAWMNMTPISSPPARGYHSMAYDSKNDRIILYGGWSESGLFYNETWAYDLDNNRRSE